MSNIYILEPPTSGKVLLKTSVGDIDIELWSKETPKTCRNFIQLCLEGYYDNTIFHRVLKGFIAQGGDPKGDGTGGESVYGETFKDEFHQRLRFVRRGLVAMANAGRDDNGSQFFFTLAATPELQNVHTIFGKVTGETLFNMLKLEEGLIENERPLYPNKIIKAEVLFNPFDDIVPREIVQPEIVAFKRKKRMPGVKNFKLLSFGAEAEEDEEETIRETQRYVEKKLQEEASDKNVVDSESEEDSTDSGAEERLENIKKKLKTDKPRASSSKNRFKKAQLEETKKKCDEIKKEIENVKREYQKNKIQRNKKDVEEKQEETKKNETIQEYTDEYNKYKDIKKTIPKKGVSREKFTLDLLAKFKAKLASAKEKDEPIEEPEEKKPEVPDDEAWLTHELHFVDDGPILAKDANTKGDDWFEIYDPRNPLNKRRRGEKTEAPK